MTSASTRTYVCHHQRSSQPLLGFQNSFRFHSCYNHSLDLHNHYNGLNSQGLCQFRGFQSFHFPTDYRQVVSSIFSYVRRPFILKINLKLIHK